MRQSIRLVYGSSEQGECHERGERNGGGTVPEMRLDAALMVLATESHPMLTRSRIQRAIEQGNICINGKSTTKPGKKIKSGDVISGEIEIEDESTNVAPQSGVKFDVMYEDSHIIVVDKPAGLVVHPGAGHKDGTLVNGLVAQYPEVLDVGESDRPGIVHRLDAETSGLLVVARSQVAYDALVAMFSHHAISRQYWAIALAPKIPDSGRFDTPYGRNPNHRIKYTSIDPNASKRAVTNYRTMARTAAGYALITCLLETGRTHQIRVHLSEHGAPIVGDAIYAPKPIATHRAIARLALHARKLAFEHPVTHESLCFVSPWPADFVAAIGSIWGENILDESW